MPCLACRRDDRRLLVPARRGDALFELTDAMMCRRERVHTLAELSLELE